MNTWWNFSIRMSFFTLFSLHDALPISEERRVGKECTPPFQPCLEAQCEAREGDREGYSYPRVRLHQMPPFR